MKKGVLILVLIVIVSGFVFSQSTNFGNPNHFIEKKYALGGSLKGWINVSLDKVPANSEVKTNLGDKISLMELLTLNEETNEIEYTCLPEDCESNYASVPDTNEISKTFSLGARESAIFGLRISGGGAGGTGFSDATDFSMKVSSDSSESIFGQLFIDVFADGENEWEPYESSGNFYNEDLGCYSDATGVGITAVQLSHVSYCEKINIPISPQVEIGAYLVATDPAPSNEEFILSANPASGGDGAACSITPTDDGRIGCVLEDLDFKVDKQEDYYVCIEFPGTELSEYKINSESGGEICGYSGEIINKKDFQIFAKPAKFAAVEEVDLNDETALGSTGSGYIEEKIQEYIDGNYKDVNGNDCSSECIVPIKITSGKNQQQEIIVSELNLKYYLDSTPSTTNPRDIYDISETPGKISSDFMQIFLDDVGFPLAEKTGEQQISVSIGGKEIFSEKIRVDKVPQVVSINPYITFAGGLTKFTAKLDTNSTSSIKSYEWDFGDGSEIEETETNSITHTFEEIGEYILLITWTDKSGYVSSKEFNVEAATPKEAVNRLIQDYLSNINSIKTKISALSSFEQDSLNSILIFDEADEILGDLQQRYLTAVSDDDYISMMADLTSLSIPASVDITKSVESLPFYPTEEGIDLDILKEIGGGDYGDDEDGYKNAVISWNAKNSKAKISSKEFTENFKEGSQELLNTFEINIGNNPEVSGAYFIIPNFEGLSFDKNYLEQETDDEDYIYFQLSGNENIKFTTTEDVDFLELNAFISPPLSRLSIVKKTNIESIKEIPKQTLIALVILLAGFIGIIIYIVLHQWYKRKYENYLFRNRNDLYNIVSYVHNMKRQGIDDKKVSAGLKKAGWNSEQVTYIMRKYYGKRTGMFELPIGKIFGTSRKTQESDVPPRKI